MMPETAGGLGWVGCPKGFWFCLKESTLRLVASKRFKQGLAVLGAWCWAAAVEGQTQGRETVGRTGWWLPENVFPKAQEIDYLFNFILYLTLSVCVGVFVVLGYFLVKYRHRPGRVAKFIHGNTKLELVWTLIPTVILALTAAFSQNVWSSIKARPELAEGERVVRIEVIGKQFKWYFHYPGADGKFGPRRAELVDATSSNVDEMVGLDRSDPAGRDDILTPQMYIPVNEKVYLDINSVDVLHSLFLLNFRVKQDAVPGLTTRMWIEADRTSAEVVGTEADGSPKPFDIACAELCGQGHFTMRGQLFVVDRKAYEAFLEEEASYLDLSGEEGEEEGY